jgi:hypothetical protein
MCCGVLLRSIKLRTKHHVCGCPAEQREPIKNGHSCAFGNELCSWGDTKNRLVKAKSSLG